VSHSPACRPFTEPYDRAELIADAVMHATALVFAVAGIVWLIDEADGLAGLQSTAVWVYGAGLVAMLVSSAAYNMCPIGSAKLMLRRFDHSAIYLFIAATYTPFIAQAGRSALSVSLLVTSWAVSWIGVTLKLGFPGRFERLSVVLCLALGWSGLFAYDAVFSPLPSSTICLIITGGVLYSMGVVFHLWDGLRFQNAIWHAFVFAAAAFQFFAVFDVVSAAVAATG
jgi:hemolysin III